MKKLLMLSFLGLTLSACDDTPQSASTETNANTSQQTESIKSDPDIKAILPENMIKDVPFSKNEKGTVIFNNVLDMFSALSLYDVEDKNIKLVSEKPLHILLHPTIAKSDEEITLKDSRYEFLSALYRIFTNTLTDEITLEVVPIDVQTNKPLPKKYHAKIKATREKALNVLQTFSPAKDFNDLVSFDKQNQYVVLGYSSSNLSSKFYNSPYATNIIKALSTGKIEIPMQDVIDPLNFNLLTIQTKLREIGMNGDFDIRKLESGKNAYTIPLNKVVSIEAVGNDWEKIETVSLQFGMVNDNDIILHTLAGLATTVLVMPDPDKAFKEINAMIDIAGKRMKKEETIKVKKVIDGITLELKVFKNMGGLSYLSYKKIKQEPVNFNE